MAGSYLVLSHGTADGMSPDASERWIELFQNTGTPGKVRTRPEVERLFTGWDLVEPGLVWASQWRPEHPDEIGDSPQRSANYVGIGLKR